VTDQPGEIEEKDPVELASRASFRFAQDDAESDGDGGYVTADDSGFVDPSSESVSDVGSSSDDDEEADQDDEELSELDYVHQGLMRKWRQASQFGDLRFPRWSDCEDWDWDDWDEWWQRHDRTFQELIEDAAREELRRENRDNPSE
jgi:hypothetical protein